MGQAKLRRIFTQQGHGKCAYCGAAATSRDHVPPECVFVGADLELITVPACDAHNGKRSKADEELRNYISVQVGKGSPAKTELWAKAFRSFNLNKKTKMRAIERIEWHPDKKHFTMLADDAQIETVLQSIVRGLFFHHFKRRVPEGIRVEAYSLRIGVQFFECMDGLNVCSVGNDQFIYAYGHNRLRPNNTVWIMGFHQGFGAYGTTGRILQDSDQDTDDTTMGQSGLK